MYRLAQAIILTRFVLGLALYIGLGVLGGKSVLFLAQQDWSHGIRPVAEQIYCGGPCDRAD
jgi:hypothetical protein